MSSYLRIISSRLRGSRRPGRPYGVPGRLRVRPTLRARRRDAEDAADHRQQCHEVVCNVKLVEYGF